MADDKVKAALKMMPYGFYAFTTKSGDDLNAMVVNWVSQMSFSPRLLAVGIQKSCYSHGLVKAGGVFGLNLFLQSNADAIMGITSSRARKPEKMQQADFTTAPQTGVPVLAGAAAYLECAVKQVVDIGGDHDIIVGEVLHADVLEEAAPADLLSLTQLGWSYAG